MSALNDKKKPLNVKAEQKEKQKKKKPPKPEPFADQADLESDMAGENWKKDTSIYPLRKPSEDSPWSVRIAWIWVGVASFSLLFIIVLLILGAIYD